MLYYQEEVRYFDVHDFVARLFGNKEHKKRVASVANAALGTIASGSLIIHRIGRSLADAMFLEGKHAIKQVDRLLSNDKFDLNKFFKDWVLYLVSNRPELKVVMDWTDYDNDNHTTLQLSLVTTHGRTTPLLWKTVDKDDLKFKKNGYEKEILANLHAIIAPNIKVTILADRGFGSIENFSYMKEELNFDYIVRIRSDIYVEYDKEKKLSGEWVPTNKTIKTMRKAKITNESYEVETVVCFQDHGMKAAWCIAASEPTLSGSSIIQWYSKRWGCEPQFRDTKDLHFGMGLSSTRIKSAKRRDKLLFINAIATVFLTVLGAAGEQLGYDKGLKANTVKHRTLSLFRQGCIYFNRLSRWPTKEMQKLMETFTKLLTEHENMARIIQCI